MTGPIIEHLDAFEEAIVAIAMRHITLDRAVMREDEASRRREEEEAGWFESSLRREAELACWDWYAEANFRRTGGR